MRYPPIGWRDRPTPYRYYQNGLDVTWYIMNKLTPPINERFFPVEVR